MVFLSSKSGPAYFSSIPYLVLGLVLVLAYVILRYQLFAAHSRVLTLLVVIIPCILVATVIHLLIGQQVGILPILAASLGAALILEPRRVPTAFINRLLRREVTDYQSIASFSQQVGRLQAYDDLVLAIRQALSKNLEVGYVFNVLAHYVPEGSAVAWYHDDHRSELGHNLGWISPIG